MIRIDRLGERDVPAALRLSTQAGWNQLDADWLRLIRLWPDYCLAGRFDGQLVATATLAVYPADVGPIGWIGMILVDESHRRRGFAAGMLDALLKVAERASVALLGLDATDLGRPVYVKKGFADNSPMERWFRPGGPFSRSACIARLLGASDWLHIEQLDRRATGADRSDLLRHLQDEPGACCHVIESDERVSAFAFLRRGRTANHLGPVIAEFPDLAADICTSLVSEAADHPILIDLPHPSPIAAALTEAGFSPMRHLTRMTRPGTSQAVLTGPLVFAASSFELG
jgi:GNAT superfamily N-acetyltransferase